eukprot:CAMPEP_0175453042 /NCGR_PEP_ID=MMETSP0095-20121207/63731_1 /TAXON_ID=311494 /ORGANISM="Alexandrium monilatum, Strain CCMP3105" /LENGTH=70 /DNA_ID=CAMNT_0016753633 /DNA_START=113 /DNA_END=322 /DNA_ORIENTATION=+
MVNSPEGTAVGQRLQLHPPPRQVGQEADRALPSLARGAGGGGCAEGHQVCTKPMSLHRTQNLRCPTPGRP